MLHHDKHGEYRVPHTWIYAWPGGGGHVAGWCLNEVHEYTDGTIRLHSRPALYVAGEPEMAALHQIYMLAQQELINHKGRRDG